MAESETVPAVGENVVLDELLHDMFTTALEGGIGYWSAATSYRQTNPDGSPDLAGFYADIVDAPDSYDFEPVRVDRDTIARGFLRIMDPEAKFGSRHRLAALFHARAAGLTDEQVYIDFDAEDADVIVQLGVFGQLVYG